MVHTTPIAVPASATIGEPDIPPKDALGGVGDPERPAEVADGATEPPAVERQQPGRCPEIHRVPDGIAERQRLRHPHQRFVIIGVWIAGRTEQKTVARRPRVGRRPRK